MRIDGSVRFEYENKKTAQTIAGLLQLDNDIAHKALKIKSWAEEKSVVTSIMSTRGSTFFSTIDDLISSEKLIFELSEI
jgi:hypothetical protein